MLFRGAVVRDRMRRGARCLKLATFTFAFVVLGAPTVATADTWLAGEMEVAGAHPRTLFGPADITALRGRLHREPYKTLLARLKVLADREVDLEAVDITSEQHKANTARAAAFLFCLDRTLDDNGEVAPFPTSADRDLMGAKAVGYLLAMYGVSRAKGWVESVNDIHTAQELHLWADTLDLLLGTNRDALGGARSLAIQRVADLAADFYGDLNIDYWLALRSLVNNHRSKSAAALGIAAIALNGEIFTATRDDGRYESARWVDFAIRNTDFVVRDLLTDDDGGFMEGGSYLAYSGIDHFPFMWAWHRYTNRAPYTLAFDEPVAPFYAFGATEPWEVPNMWTDPALQRQLDAAVRTMLPDGSMPPVDDSTPGSRLFYGAFVRAEFPDPGLYRWAWERNGFAAGGSVETAPFLIAAFDERFTPRSPAEVGMKPSQALPYAGQMIFRSGWEPEAIYVSLLAEHGTAAAWGQTRWGDRVDGAGGHEHPDGTSVLLYAAGEPLIIDSGYLGWDNHDKVNKTKNHSLISVDGFGPGNIEIVIPPFEIRGEEIVLLEPEVEGGWVAAGDAQAWVTRFDLETEGAQLAEVWTRYWVDAPNTTIVRRGVFLAERFLVLHDLVQTSADEAGEHYYEHALHTNCGGTSGGSYATLDNGALCTRPGARVRVIVDANRPAEQSERVDIHDAGGWEERTHSVLETLVRAEAPEQVQILSLLAPEVWDGTAYDESQATAGDCPGPCITWSLGELRCEAWIGDIREVRADSERRMLLAGAGAYCRDRAALAGYFTDFPDDPDLMLTARFHFDDGGEVDSWRIQVLGQAGGAKRSYLILPEVAGKEPDGACASVALGDGTWLVSLVAPGVVRTKSAARRVVANIRLVGHRFGEPLVVPVGAPFRLDSSGSCGATGDVVTWRIGQVPELSRVPLGEAVDHEPVLELTPDLPGVYRVQLSLGGAAEAAITVEAEGEPAPGSSGDDGGPAGDTVAPPNRGCGCATGGGGWWLWLCSLAWWLLRRRTASIPPRP